MSFRRKRAGFTLIELIIVITIVGLLSAIFLPRFVNVPRQARIGTLEGVEGAMKSAAAIAKVKAISQGISPAAADPGDQSAYIIQMEGLNVEVDWYTLCPESESERGVNSPASMLDFIHIEENEQSSTSPIDGTLYAQFDNQYTWVGYDIRAAGAEAGSGAGGCYVEYNSFGIRGVDSACSVRTVFDDC